MPWRFCKTRLAKISHTPAITTPGQPPLIRLNIALYAPVAQLDRALPYRSSAQEERIEYAAKMGKEPNHNERAAICLVVLVEVGAEPVPALHQSANNQTGRADERNQPQRPVKCYPRDVLAREWLEFPAIALREHIVDDEDPGASRQQDHNVSVQRNFADTGLPPCHDEQHQCDHCPSC